MAWESRAVVPENDAPIGTSTLNARVLDRRRVHQEFHLFACGAVLDLRAHGIGEITAESRGRVGVSRSMDAPSARQIDFAGRRLCGRVARVPVARVAEVANEGERFFAGLVDRLPEHRTDDGGNLSGASGFRFGRRAVHVRRTPA
jgi:hypothetical protein